MAKDTGNTGVLVGNFHEQERKDQIEWMEWLHDARPKTEGAQMFHGCLSAAALYEKAKQAYLFGLREIDRLNSGEIVVAGSGG